jgi:predicted  nucleic acid-binding Zn-ribbon protein
LVFNDKYLEYHCKKCGNKYEDNYFKWCKQCQLNQLKINFANWTSGNERIDDFIQERQLKVNGRYDTVFEWIPYNEFIEIKEIRDNWLTLAIWKKGPLSYDKYEKKWIRKSCEKKVYLKYLHNSQDIIDKLLNMVLEFFYEFILNTIIHYY